MKRPVSLAVFVASAAACTLTPEENVFEPGFGSAPASADPEPAGTSAGPDGTSGALPDDGPELEGSESGLDEPDVTSGAAPDPEPEATSGSTGESERPIDTCASDVLGVGIAGTTAGRSNETAGSCGGGQAPDHAFVYTAEADGVYTFDTNGSDFDTILYVLDGTTCGGAELACDDDGGSSLQSEVTLPLQAGDAVVVVVDGYNLSSGAFLVSTTVQTADVCDPIPLAGSLPVSATGTTAGTSADMGSCGGGGAPEQLFTWTAPAAGTYTVQTAESDYDTVLYVRDGSCIGPELGCDDDGGAGLQSSLTLALAADQEIVIVVDGYSSNAGDFVVTVE